ncbi:probable peroxisomal acyl-coenzyme A oxidase 1 [Bicyclus anynana]|uniref:Acyl-coenzyme A oxidase n=1 Tax=Bicyclus anynana TaxID=110368 RepID=A0A6J1NKR9_BICAN|nr:probable peroxisomal acyl-coenzyme A oxidase 1 [Bicyclus anynana]
MGQMNEDLKREREKCSFNMNDLINLMDGGPDKTKMRREREDIMISRRDAYADIPEEYLSYKEQYEQAVKKSAYVFSLLRRLQHEGKTNLHNYRDVMANFLRSSDVGTGFPIAIHYIMFIPTIMSQASEEQQAQWLQRAWDCNIVGSYAQTELGHGTFIRGLETTATYDPSTKEFVLNSPTLTSYKWWGGGLGQTANYAIVVAQLYTKGECHGVHLFIVQLRDEETHMPLPGIKIGDVGLKMALNGVNNGFLGFNNCRIPRNQMLMKHSQVLEDGTYVRSPNSKLNYGAMVFTRVVIACDMVNYLSKAATIAVRFSAVRRQCQSKAGEPESQILDYLTQQHKLLPAVAACYALKVTAGKLWDTFSIVNEEMIAGNYERLPEIHALSCCLKAIATRDAASFIETCRLACGGHGFTYSSNLPATYCNAVAACTYEGENTVLLLQTARFLAKTWQDIDNENGKLTPTVEYLKTAKVKGYSHEWVNSVENIVYGFQVVSMRKIASCVKSMQTRVASGATFEDAWNMASVQLVSAAEAHCRVMILSTFSSEIKEMTRTTSKEIKRVLEQIVTLYAVYWALERLSDLLQYTTITGAHVDNLRAWYEELLTQLRPNAVGLVDAFDLRDEMLQSTLGAYDGRVYERLMEAALQSPLNAEPVNYTFQKYLKPFLQGKL